MIYFILFYFWAVWEGFGELKNYFSNNFKAFIVILISSNFDIIVKPGCKKGFCCHLCFLLHLFIYFFFNNFCKSHLLVWSLYVAADTKNAFFWLHTQNSKHLVVSFWPDKITKLIKYLIHMSLHWEKSAFKNTTTSFECCLNIKNGGKNAFFRHYS